MSARTGLEGKKKEASHALIMPAHVRAGQIIGLVEVTGGLGSPIDISRLADEFGADIATLLPVLDAGEMLGLVKIEKGDVSLTEFGLKFQRTTKNKVRLVKDQLSRIEPFKSALELVARGESVSAAEVADALIRKGIRWHHEQEVNEAVVSALLIHWAIYAALLEYKSDKFQKFS